MKQRYSSLQRIAYDPIHDNRLEPEDHRIHSSDLHNNMNASSLTSAASSRIMSNRSHLPPPPTSNSQRNSQIDFGMTPTTSQLPTSILSRSSYVKQTESHEQTPPPPPFLFDTQADIAHQHSPYQFPANSSLINHQLRNSSVGSHSQSSNIGISTKSLQQSQVVAATTTAATTFQQDKIKSFEKIAISVDQLADCVSDYMIITNSTANSTSKMPFSTQQQQMSPYQSISSRSGYSNGMNSRQKVIDEQSIMLSFKNLIHATVGNFLVEQTQTTCPLLTQETRETITAADDHSYYPGSISSRTTLLTTKNDTTTPHCLSTKHMNILSTQYQSTRSDDYSSEIDRLQEYIRELENQNRDRDCGQLAEKLSADRIEFESIKADLAEYVRSFKLNFLRVQLRSHRASDIVESELFNEFYDILTTTESNWETASIASKKARIQWNSKFNDDTRLLNVQWQKASKDNHNDYVLKKRSRSCCILQINDGVLSDPLKYTNINASLQSARGAPLPGILAQQSEAILEKNAEISSLKVEKEIEFSIFHTFLREFTSNARNNLFDDILETGNQAEQEEQKQQQSHGKFNQDFDEIDSQGSPSKIELSRFMKYDDRKQSAQQNNLFLEKDSLQGGVFPFKNLMEFTIGNEPSELFVDNQQRFSSQHLFQQQQIQQQDEQQLYPNHSFFNSLTQEQQQLFLLHGKNNNNYNHNRSFNQDIANISCINRVDDGGDAQQAISFLDTLDNKPTSRFMCQSSFKKNNRFNQVNWQSHFTQSSQQHASAAAVGAIGFNYIDEREEPQVGEATLFGDDEDDDGGDQENHFNQEGRNSSSNNNNNNNKINNNPLAQVRHLKQKLSEEFNRLGYPSSLPPATGTTAQGLRSKNVPVHMSFDSNFVQNSQNNNNINQQRTQLNQMQQQQQLSLLERRERAVQARNHLESFCGVGEDEEKSRIECFMNENFDEVTNSLNLDQIGDFEDSMTINDGPTNPIVAISGENNHHNQQEQLQLQFQSKLITSSNNNNINSNLDEKSKKKNTRKARPSVDLPKLDLSTINCTDTLKNARGSTKSLVPLNLTSCVDKNAGTTNQHVFQNNSNVNQQHPSSTTTTETKVQNYIGQQAQIGSGGVNSLLSQISPIHRVNFMMPGAQAGGYQLPQTMNNKNQNWNHGKQNESMLSACGNTQIDILRVLNETNGGGFNSDSCVVDGVQMAAGEVFLKGICINLERENRFLTEENTRLQLAIEKERVYWEEESMRIRGEFAGFEAKKQKYRVAKEELDARKKQHEETEKLVGQQQLMIVLQEKKILCSKQQLELQWSELEKKRDEVERTEKMVSDEWENVKKQASQMQEFIAKQKAMKEMLAREFATSKQTLALESEDISSKQRMLRKKEVTLDAYEKSLSEREARHKHAIIEERALFAEEVARFKEKNESDARILAEVEQKREAEVKDIQREITLLKSVSKQEAAKYALDLKRLKHIEGNLEKREKEFQIKYSAFLQDQLAFSEKQGKIATDSKRMKDLLPSLKNLATKMAGEENDKSRSHSNNNNNNIITKENDVENGILRARTKRFSQYL